MTNLIQTDEIAEAHRSRRLALKSTLATLVSGSFCALSLASETKAATESSTQHGTSIEILTKALRVAQNDVCTSEANRLDGLSKSVQSFDLHLRHAGLGEHQARLIALAMREFGSSTAAAMQSFSISYNPNLGNAGITVLINSFPPTLTEVGLVGCQMQDQSASTLLEWAQTAQSLRMMCLEQNNLSAEMRQKISALGKDRADLFIVT